MLLEDLWQAIFLFFFTKTIIIEISNRFAVLQLSLLLQICVYSWANPDIWDLVSFSCLLRCWSVSSTESLRAKIFRLYPTAIHILCINSPETFSNMMGLKVYYCPMTATLSQRNVAVNIVDWRDMKNNRSTWEIYLNSNILAIFLFLLLFTSELGSTIESRGRDANFNFNIYSDFLIMHREW